MEKEIERFFDAEVKKIDWDWDKLTPEYMATLDYKLQCELLEAMVGRFTELGVKYKRQIKVANETKADIMILREQRLALAALLRSRYG